jgi:hypothetical protein
MVRKQSGSTGYGVSASFALNLHAKDLVLLHKIQLFFGGIGRVHVANSGSTVSYTVEKKKDLYNVIIPHFQQYSLRSAKVIDFGLWVKCLQLIENKEHLTVSGLNKILSIKSALNLGVSDKLALNFPNIKPMVRPEYVVSNFPIDPPID